MSGAAALGATLLCYLLGAAVLGAGHLLGRPAAEVMGGFRRSAWVRAGRILAGTGAVLHTAAIGLRCAELHRAPFATPAEALSLLAWLVALVYLASDLLWRLSASGGFALGFSFLLVLLASVRDTSGPGAASPILAERAVSLHIVAILAAFAAFALAFCCAALYLVARRILKSKHGLAWMKRLPPLGTLERASLVLVAAGFPLLTLGILAGLVRASGGGMAPGWLSDPKTVLAFAVWVTYGLYLMVRLAAGWAANRAAWVLIAGIALCLLALVVPTAAHRFVG